MRHFLAAETPQTGLRTGDQVSSCSEKGSTPQLPNPPAETSFRAHLRPESGSLQRLSTSLHQRRDCCVAAPLVLAALVPR
ncbi:hypothetical protein C2845_PM10G03520 [Panicum miliaceum]|uniref:Uncharacterized protein n=1 Tax=Panicum miliaceum TaxID=4540 RepID=A0A3L6PCU8_PANMI|nr:hypothetical protein C2845_PM10G03520 [Panicum miliaceum]